MANVGFFLWVLHLHGDIILTAVIEDYTKSILSYLQHSWGSVTSFAFPCSSSNIFAHPLLSPGNKEYNYICVTYQQIWMYCT